MESIVLTCVCSSAMSAHQVTKQALYKTDIHIQILIMMPRRKTSGTKSYCSMYFLVRKLVVIRWQIRVRVTEKVRKQSSTHKAMHASSLNFWICDGYYKGEGKCSQSEWENVLVLLWVHIVWNVCMVWWWWLAADFV